MKCIGNGATEYGISLAVQRLQCTGGKLHIYLTGHIEILIEDEFDFLILLTWPLYETWTGVDLDPATAPNGKLSIYTAVIDGLLRNLFIGQQTQILGLDQIPVRDILQSKCHTGNEI